MVALVLFHFSYARAPPPPPRWPVVCILFHFPMPVPLSAKKKTLTFTTSKKYSWIPRFSLPHSKFAQEGKPFSTSSAGGHQVIHSKGTQLPFWWRVQSWTWLSVGISCIYGMPAWTWRGEAGADTGVGSSWGNFLLYYNWLWSLRCSFSLAREREYISLTSCRPSDRDSSQHHDPDYLEMGRRKELANNRKG